jgi:hypothetical protein
MSEDIAFRIGQLVAKTAVLKDRVARLEKHTRHDQRTHGRRKTTGGGGAGGGSKKDGVGVGGDFEQRKALREGAAKWIGGTHNPKSWKEPTSSHVDDMVAPTKAVFDKLPRTSVKAKTPMDAGVELRNRGYSVPVVARAGKQHFVVRTEGTDVHVQRIAGFKK